MRKKPAPVAVALALANVQIVKNVHLVQIINPLNQIKQIISLYFGKVPKI